MTSTLQLLGAGLFWLTGVFVWRIAAANAVARNAFHVPADSASTATGETPSPASPAQGTATHP